MRSGIKILLIVASITVFFVLLYKIPLFSPSDNEIIIGCNNYQQDPQGNPPPPQEPPYGNCVADGLALLNKKEYSKINEAQVRTDIIDCLRAKGYNVPAEGIPITDIDEAVDCKIKAMGGLGFTESIGTGKGKGPPKITTTTSPFKKNCPFSGTWILMYGSSGHSSVGHAAACFVLYCDPVTGELKAECHSSSSAPVSNPPLPNPLPVTVGPTGTISAEPSTWSGGQAMGWVQVNYPG